MRRRHIRLRGQRKHICRIARVLWHTHDCGTHPSGGVSVPGQPLSAPRMRLLPWAACAAPIAAHAVKRPSALSGSFYFAVLPRSLPDTGLSRDHTCRSAALQTDPDLFRDLAVNLLTRAHPIAVLTADQRPSELSCGIQRRLIAT